MFTMTLPDCLIKHVKNGKNGIVTLSDADDCAIGTGFYEESFIGIRMRLTINEDKRNQGFGTKLFHSMLDMLQKNIDDFETRRIVASHYGNNAAMKRILFKEGFEIEAHRNNIMHDGELTTLTEYVKDLTVKESLRVPRHPELYVSGVMEAANEALYAESTEEANKILDRIPEIINDGTEENAIGNAVRDDVAYDINNIFKSQMESYANNVTNVTPVRVSELIRELSSDDIDPNGEVYLQINEGLAFNYTFPLTSVHGTSTPNYVAKGIDIYFPNKLTEKTVKIGAVVLS